MSADDESSATVQKEVEAERAGLVSTLDALRENLKPENVIDEVMANAKITTSDISDRIWQTARNHPIPSVMIGLGAAMILGVGQKVRSSAARRDHDWSDDGRFPRGDAYIKGRPDDDRSTLEKIGGRATAAKEQVSSQLQALGSRAAASASQIADSASDLRRQAGRTASAYASSARQTLPSASRIKSMSNRDQLGNSVSRLLDEQPLVLAALGVAVGAALGAVIPSTDAESRLMGDASVSFRSRAQELAQSELSHLKETASNTLGELKQTASDRGVSTDNLSGLVQDAADKVKSAAHDVADHAANTSGLKS